MIRSPRQLAGVSLESGEYLDAHEGIAAKIDALAKPQQKDRKPNSCMMSPLATRSQKGRNRSGPRFRIFKPPPGPYPAVTTALNVSIDCDPRDK